MNKFFLLLVLVGACCAAAWFLFPVFSARNDAKILSIFTPEIREFLLQDTTASRALLKEYRSVSSTLDAIGKELEVAVAGTEKDRLKQNYLRGGVARLSLVKRITDAYEENAGQGSSNAQNMPFPSDATSDGMAQNTPGYVQPAPPPPPPPPPPPVKQDDGQNPNDF